MAALPKGELDIKLDARERMFVIAGLECRSAVLRRRINSEENQAIREVLDSEHKAISALLARV